MATLTKDERTLLYADKLGFGDENLQTINRSDLDTLTDAVTAAILAKLDCAEPVGKVESAAFGAAGFHVYLLHNQRMPKVGDAMYTANPSARRLHQCQCFIDDMCNETFDTWSTGYRMQQIALNIKAGDQ